MLKVSTTTQGGFAVDLLQMQQSAMTHAINGCGLVLIERAGWRGAYVCLAAFALMILGIDGGAEGDRTPDLRIANATLSQLSYGPTASVAPFRGRGGTMVIVLQCVKRGSGPSASAPCGPLRLAVRSACHSPPEVPARCMPS